MRVWDENARKHAWYQFPEETNLSTAYGNSSTSETLCTDPSNRARLFHNQARLVCPSNRARLVITKLDCGYGNRGRVVFVLEW